MTFFPELDPIKAELATFVEQFRLQPCERCGKNALYECECPALCPKCGKETVTIGYADDQTEWCHDCDGSPSETLKAMRNTYHKELSDY